MLLHHPPWATLDWFHYVGLLSDSFTLDPSRRLRRAAAAVCFWLPVVLVVILATAPPAVLASLLTADTGGPPSRAAPRGLLLAARWHAASLNCGTWSMHAGPGGKCAKSRCAGRQCGVTLPGAVMASCLDYGHAQQRESMVVPARKRSPMGKAARSGGAEKMLAVRMLSLLTRRAWSNARSSPKVIRAA